MFLGDGGSGNFGMMMRTGVMRSDGCGGIEYEYVCAGGERVFVLTDVHKRMIGINPRCAAGEPDGKVEANERR